MTDISQHLPQQSKTVAAIYAAYKKAGDAEPTRGYLGASIIGHPCERYLWYCFRQCCKPEFDGRMYRLFKTGDLEEARFAKDLRDIGCTVYETDEKGDQFAVSALGGHFTGHMDSAILGLLEAPKTWHVGEYKTHNNKSFTKLKKEGVQKSKPQHYAQMQVYMRLTGMKRALYLARNKDTDELYSERIRYDEYEAGELILKAERIISATSPPDRISKRPDFYQCSWCDAKTICWGTNHKEDILGVVSDGPALPIPVLSCRQCCHATPIMNGEGAKWKCERHGAGTWDLKKVMCKDHLVLPDLLVFTEPTDSGNDFIEFTNADDITWKHGAGGYSSEELMKLPASALGNKMLQTAKDLFGAVATSHKFDVLARYPREDSRIIWKGLFNELETFWHDTYHESLLELKPIERYNYPDYDAIELENGRLIISWQNGTAEIRQGVE